MLWCTQQRFLPFSEVFVKIETNRGKHICKLFMWFYYFKCAFFISNCAANQPFCPFLFTLRTWVAFTGSKTRHFKSHVTCHVTRYRCLFHNVIQQNQSCCYVFESLWKNLMMLSLYLYTLIIGHKSCNMLSILHKLTLQKKLQNFVTNNVFLDKNSKITTTIT